MHTFKLLSFYDIQKVYAISYIPNQHSQRAVEYTNTISEER